MAPPLNPEDNDLLGSYKFLFPPYKGLPPPPQLPILPPPIVPNENSFIKPNIT